MNKKTSLIFALLVGVGLMTTGCTGTKRALGVERVTPDEFRTVSKAPLVVPPDYNLRPPKPGAPRPQDLSPTQAARVALLANVEHGSAGQQRLVSNAGADLVDPDIRNQVDFEEGSLARKSTSFANEVIYGEPQGLTEEQRAKRKAAIERAVGDKLPEIKSNAGRTKIPGL